MFDTMTITKAVAGFCSALLIFLLGSWIADELYLPHGPAPIAFVIDLGDDGADAPIDAAPEVVDYDALYAQADAAAGEAQWRNCRACHALEAGRNGTGPYLHGVVGRPVNAAAGFGNYSGALAQVGDVWTVEALSRFIENPRGVAPGTTMAYAGMRSRTDRLNLIAYIESQSN
jgi:cytochrome c